LISGENEMRGMGLLLALITLAVVAYLVVSDYQSISEGGEGKISHLESAKDAANEASKAIKKMEAAARQAADSD
jgi:Tfp pilus assembly protein PilX|tara:strand:- start:599 stop:820 length:222 start_codon:yes stop_codon:yes gene_type:complete